MEKRKTYTIFSNLERNRIDGILELVQRLLEIHRLLSPEPRQRQLRALFFDVLALSLGGSHRDVGFVFFCFGLVLLFGLGSSLLALGGGNGAGAGCGVGIAGFDGRSLLMRGAIGEGTFGHDGFFGLGLGF